MKSLLFNGWTVHARLHPVVHRFRVPVTFHAFNLAELPEIDQAVRGFGFNQPAAVSLYEKDYLSPGPATFIEKLHPWMERAGVVAPPERVTLVTCPRRFGRVFNPVSFYVLGDGDNRPAGLVAEVNNTFKDRHVYAVPLSPETDPSPVQAGENPKEFHVSPFNNMEGNYRFSARMDGGELYIGVDLFRDGVKIMETWIEGTGEALDTAALRKELWRRPFRPWMTMPRILAQAALLKFKHRLPHFSRPEPSHPHTLLSRGR